MEKGQNEFKWNKIHYSAAIVISLVCLFLIFSQSFIKKFVVDNTTVMLLGIAVLPWLSLFFKKGRIGEVGWDNTGKAYGTTKTTVSPREEESKNITIAPKELSAGSEKILRTLWRYQKATFKDDFSKRWTFVIGPASSEFQNYLTGLAPLVAKKLVVVSPENNHCMLSNEVFSM